MILVMYRVLALTHILELISLEDEHESEVVAVGIRSLTTEFDTTLNIIY